MNICPEEDDFHASNGWLSRFTSRHGLTSRSVTSHGQKVPSDAKCLAEKFFQYTKEMTDTRNFELMSIGNMNETPLWFDLPCSKSYDFRDVKSVQARTGKEKLRYTVVLSAMADGTKLPCMVIFKGLKNVPKGRFPNDVIVEVNEKGFMTADMLNKWKQCVWKTRPGGYFRPSSLIVFDSATSH